MRRSLVRLAAPAAFLLAATIAVLLVRSALREGDEEAPRRPAPAATRTQEQTTTKAAARRTRPARPARTYTVQTGDTLDQIALDHGTTVQDLLTLNPDVEPTELRVGQRLRLP